MSHDFKCIACVHTNNAIVVELINDPVQITAALLTDMAFAPIIKYKHWHCNKQVSDDMLEKCERSFVRNVDSSLYCLLTLVH